MATPALSRMTTCLSCLRRLAKPSVISSSPASLIQVRNKSKKKQLAEEEQGVVVRLLKDVPRFGRRDAIFRVPPGRMRNIWYPYKMAEYMTSARFNELGLNESSIGMRDPMFGVAAPRSESAPAAAEPVAVRRKRSELNTMPPETAHDLMRNLVPSTLIFARKPIKAPEPEPLIRRSPSLAFGAELSSAASGEQSSKSQASEPVAVEDTAIFGSVSTADIANAVKDAVRGDANNLSVVALEAKDIKFLGLKEGEETTKLKNLGSWEYEIYVGELEPIRRTVQIVPEESS